MPLTDFVIADRADARLVCDSACPSDKFDGLDAKGIDPVKLGTLYAVLTDTEYDENFIAGPPLCDGGDEGPWVREVPIDLVQRLAQLNASQIRTAATKWAETEEFSPQYDNWSPEEVHEVLTELAKLCRRAVAVKKSLLLWMSL